MCVTVWLIEIESQSEKERAVFDWQNDPNYAKSKWEEKRGVVFVLLSEL